MNVNHFFSLFFFILFANFSIVSPQDPFEDSDATLNLKSTGRNIENSLSLYITGKELKLIKADRGDKINLHPLVMIINNDSVDVEKVRTRGQTTLYYPRKSFSFTLRSSAEFSHGEVTESFGKFYALSLSMDRNYCNNRLAFEMMEICGLFNLFYTYCAVSINGHSEGIYLIVERPEDWALLKRDSPLLIRRGYDHKIEKIASDKEIDKSEIRQYCGYYEQIYKCLNKYKGKALYDSLATWLDIDLYMKWLAFNFYVRNGDYTDEVWFYFDPLVNKFRIIPWDYDDIFFKGPHEGYGAAGNDKGEKLIFSTEDLLDKKIVSDPELYRIYLGKFEGLMNQLTTNMLKTVFENTYSELHPYYTNKEIISQSYYDAYKGATLGRMEQDMQTMFSQLRLTREIYLRNIKMDKSASDNNK